MQIHELNTGTPAATDVLAMDTGSDSYKTTPGNVVPDYTSGDSSTATSWTSVTAVGSGLSFSTLIGRITTMMKNVRYLYTILGSSTFSTVASTITGAIGNTALGTTATTLSGAIAEHESDISTLNSKLTPSANTGCIKVGGICFITYMATELSIAGQGGLVFTLPSGYRPSELRHITSLATYAGTSGVFRFTVDTNGEVKTFIGANTVTAIYMENLPFPL